MLISIFVHFISKMIFLFYIEKLINKKTIKAGKVIGQVKLQSKIAKIDIPSFCEECLFSIFISPFKSKIKKINDIGKYMIPNINSVISFIFDQKRSS